MDTKGIELIVVAALVAWYLLKGKTAAKAAAPTTAPVSKPTIASTAQALTNASFIASLPTATLKVMASQMSQQLGYPVGEAPDAIVAAVSSGQLDLSQIDWYYG